MGGASNTNTGAAVNPRDAFLDVILADPDDDTPRLVYADWLTERGDPLGEVIVVQCTRARLQREGKRATAEYRRVVRRERELISQPATRYALTLVRGFRAHVVHEDPANLQKHWAEYRRLPIETITLRRDPKIRDIAWIAHQPDAIPSQAIGVQTRTGSLALEPSELAHLDEADEMLVWPFEAAPDRGVRGALRRIHFNAPGDALAAFAKEPAPNVVEISFMGGSVEVAKALATKLEKVQKLSGWLEPSVALDFLEHLRIPTLTNFALQGYQKKTFDVEGGRRIAASAILPQLTNLIADVPLDTALATALADRAMSLEVLSPGGGVSESGVHAFAESSLPGRLRWLNLRNDRTVASLVPFARAGFTRLESLTLEGFRIDDDVARALADNAGLAQLVDLKLVACQLKPSAAEILAESPHLGALLEPKLIHCRLWSETMETLKARWPDASFLQD